MNSGLFKNNVTNKTSFYKSYLIYMYKQDLALNNLQRLICLKHNQPTLSACI